MSKIPQASTPSKKKKFNWLKLVTVVMTVLPSILTALDNGEDAVIELAQPIDRPGFLEVASYSGLTPSADKLLSVTQRKVV